MMKAFRRRFMILNMSLVGIVLLAAFVVIGTMIRENEYSDLKNTMSAVLKPWNTNNAEVPKHSDSPESDIPPEKKEKPAPKPDDRNTDKKHEHNNNITTIFYYRSEKKVSLISEEPVFDEDVETVTNAILAQNSDFGKINQFHVIYYREKTGSVVKIAVCDKAYIGSRVAKTILILSLVYVLSMCLLLIISFRLAVFAEKPLRNSIEMERKFVADVSHDLKTPITVIMANNSILKSNKDMTVSDNMQWINSTDKASEDMMQLIGNMLTLSSVDAQPRKVSTVSVSLSSAAERCILQFESVAYEKNVKVEEDMEENLTVCATEEYIKRICSSLIENALKYEPEGGKIIIRSYSRMRKVYFMVQNIGSRIAPEDMPHIFDRFYRSDRARTLSKGHGLGLPIIKQMITLCGGDIQVVSNDKEGTIFTVIFRKAS